MKMYGHVYGSIVPINFVVKYVWFILQHVYVMYYEIYYFHTVLLYLSIIY